VTLGITNVSFVAQTVDWNAAHVYATLREAHRHPGLAFVRILQRCPHYMPDIFQSLQQDPSRVLLLKHPNGIQLDDAVARLFKNQEDHDPTDLAGARHHAAAEEVVPVGLLYRNEQAERYDLESARSLGMGAAAKVEEVQSELDNFLI
jgi:2-oxoglutarate ferredoxin oxidoreductase subunit beta